MASFDLVVVGAGIVGLAHALAAARRRLRVLVLERDAAAGGASVRNFGFVTISGQEDGATHGRALRSRAAWETVAAEAGIDIVQRGALVAARRPEALAVLEEYAATEPGRACTLLDAGAARARLPALRAGVVGALASPAELRIDARAALPRLARWLEERHGVVFSWGTAAYGVDGGVVRHARGSIAAGAVVIAPGTAVAAFAPALAARINLRQCTLQMLRLAPAAARLPGVVMTDLSLLRYGGFACLPAAARLRARLAAECAAELDAGVHLIVAQDADGALVVGDSHRVAADAAPFGSSAVEQLILGELDALLDLPGRAVAERWLGHYPVADLKPVVSEALQPRVRLVTVTGGTGMSTAFAIGEDTVAELLG